MSIEFGNVALSSREVGQILRGETPELSLWDRFCDLFRPETKRSVVDKLVGEMRTPGESGLAYLGKFEQLVEHAKPEELHRFKVVAERHPSDPTDSLILRFAIDAETVASVALRTEGLPLESYRVYAALHQLRGIAGTDPSGGLGSHATVAELTDLIREGLGDIDSIRHHYGQFTRALRAKLPQDPATAPQGSPPGPEAFALHALNAIEAKLAEDYPRALVRDLFASLVLAEERRRAPDDPRYEAIRQYERGLSASLAQHGLNPFEPPPTPGGLNPFETPPAQRSLNPFEPPPAEPLHVGDLCRHDADFTGVSIHELLAFHEQHPQLIDLKGSSVRELLDAGASFSDVDFAKLKQLEAQHGLSFTGVCLGELLDAGVQGGGYPLFHRSAPPVDAVNGHPTAQGAEEPAAPWLESLPLYAHKGDTSLELSRALDAGFTLQQVPLSKVAMEFDLEHFDGRRLLASGIDLESWSITQLQGLSIDLTDVPAGDLARRGVSFEQRTLKQVAGLGLDLRGADLALLLEQGVSLENTRVSRLLPRDPAARGDATEPNDLRLNLERLSIDDLISHGVDLEGASVKRLKNAGVGFGTVGYATLRDKHCDFGELTAADVPDLGPRFFEGACVGELLDSSLLAGCELQGLLDRGARLEGVSVKALLARGVRFTGLSFDALKADADFTGASWKLLRQSGLDVRGVPFASLASERVSFAGLSFAGLTEHLPKAVMGASTAEKSFLRGALLTQLAAEVDLQACDLAGLIERGVKLNGASMSTLLQEDILRLENGSLPMKGLHLSDLAKAGAGSEFLARVPWKTLQKSRLSFDEPLAKLLDAGISFTGLKPAELAESLRGWLRSGTVSDKERKFFSGVSVSRLMDANLDLSGSQLEDLADRGITLDGFDVAELLRRKVKLGGLKFDDLDRRGATFAGASVRDLMEAGLDMEGLSFSRLKARGVSFKGIRIDQLPPDLRFDADTTGDPQLAGTPRPTPVAELFAAELDLSGSSPKDLLPRGATLDGPSVTALLARNLRLEGLRFSQLDPQARAALSEQHLIQLYRSGADLDAALPALRAAGIVLSGLDIPWLMRHLGGKGVFRNVPWNDVLAAGVKLKGASSGPSPRLAELIESGMTFAATSVSSLRQTAGLDCSGARLADLLDRGATLEDLSLRQLMDSGLSLEGVSLATLLQRRPDLDLSGCALAHLLAAGVTVGDLSLAVLVDKGVRLEGLTFAHLADLPGADFGRIAILKLQQAGLDLKGAPFAKLREQVSFQDVKVGQLDRGIRFEGCSRQHLQDAGLVFDELWDRPLLLERGLGRPLPSHTMTGPAKP